MAALAPWLALALLCLYVVWPGLDAPLVWDDLHLVRPYSPAELAGTWRGPWDPDGVETPGLRPLTTYFNHARASLFGDSTGAHRLLLVGLFVLYVALLGRLAAALFDAPRLVAPLAGALAFTSLANAANYLWVADGVHLLAGALIVAALLGLARRLRGAPARSLFGALVALAAALLTRPEANAAYPLLLLTYLAARSPRLRSLRRPGRSPPPAARFALAAGALLLAYWAWQRAVVPDLPAIGLFPREYLWALYESALGIANPDHAVRWPARAPSAAVFVAGLLATVGLALWTGPRQAVFWSLAALAAALPCLAAARSNLLLLPIGFWSLALATVLVEAGARGRAARALAVLAFAAMLLPGALAGRTLAAEHRRQNLEWVCADAVALYGDQRAAALPPARRRAVLDHLAALEIHSGADARARLAALAAEGRAFVPSLSLLVDPGGKITPCGPALADLVR